METISSTNATTPLVLLPPSLAFKISIITFLHVGATAVLIWDILQNVSNDYKLLLRFKIGVSAIIYFLSRFSLLVYCISRAILLTLPVGHCSQSENAINVMLAVFSSCTTTLFYLRIYAVYHSNKIVVAVFTTTWLATIAMSATLPLSFAATQILESQFCLEKLTDRNLLGPTCIVLLLNDILISFAITYKLYTLYPDNGTSKLQRLGLLISGPPLPHLPKVVLQDSQVDCLIITTTKFVLTLLLYLTHLPTNVMFLTCHVVVVNILTCRVYRNIRMSIRVYDVPTQTRNLTSHELALAGRERKASTFLQYGSSGGASSNPALTGHGETRLDMSMATQSSDEVISEEDGVNLEKRNRGLGFV